MTRQLSEGRKVRPFEGTIREDLKHVGLMFPHPYVEEMAVSVVQGKSATTVEYKWWADSCDYETSVPDLQLGSRLGHYLSASQLSEMFGSVDRLEEFGSVGRRRPRLPETGHVEAEEVQDDAATSLVAVTQGLSIGGPRAPEYSDYGLGTQSGGTAVPGRSQSTIGTRGGGPYTDSTFAAPAQFGGDGVSQTIQRPSSALDTRSYNTGAAYYNPGDPSVLSGALVRYGSSTAPASGQPLDALPEERDIASDDDRFGGASLNSGIQKSITPTQYKNREAWRNAHAANGCRFDPFTQKIEDDMDFFGVQIGPSTNDGSRMPEVGIVQRVGGQGLEYILS